MIDEIRKEPGQKYALAFTILVHVGLVVALFLGVQWKSSKPEVMEVELWSATPTPATYVPPPPPPPPEVKPEPKPVPRVEPKPESLPPHKPDIAVKEEKKKKPDPKPEPKPEPPKQEAKKPELKPEPKPEAKPQPKFDFNKELANETAQLKNRPSTNAQHLANAAAAEAEQRASAASRGLQAWGDKVSRHVRQYVVLPNSIQGNPQAIFELRVLPTGDVLQPIRLKRSSGNASLDAAVERAIIKASPLPKPESGAFPNPLEIKYKPLEE